MLPPKEITDWLKEQLFETVPMAIAVIDQAFNLVHANQAFEQMFGTWRNRKCYDVYKGRGTICPDCKGSKAFRDGRPRVNEEIGYNKDGRPTRYIKHTVPIVDADGDVPFLIEMSTDVTETEQIRREYQLLFDQVPCNILLIDRDFRIVRTNKRVRDTIGALEGDYCFKGLKGFDHKCSECTARKTFEDGKLHTGHHIWRTRDGQTIHLHVITVPLRLTDEKIDMVMEMGVDVTQTLRLKDGLNFAHSFLETLVATSMDGIFAVDQTGNVTILNPAARKLLGVRSDRTVGKEELASVLPEGFVDQVTERSKHVYLREAQITNFNRDDIPVRLVGNRLMMDDKPLGAAFSMQDLSELKQLQDEKLEAERQAAVGQTVAGLAHGVKNLITALEGGMYMLSSGIGKADIDRVRKGMEMLERNIERISQSVRGFLTFSKGREFRALMTDPESIAGEVVDMYETRAGALGIDLCFVPGTKLAPAAMDYERMHECLTNLVGNAIDACRANGAESGSRVTVRLYETDGVITYEVADDGCGMDPEIKKKVFNTFFTTKGLEGTGLGLLMTRKIVQEHGGTIDLESEQGQGSIFRIRLPRRRLPKVSVEN